MIYAPISGTNLFLHSGHSNAPASLSRYGGNMEKNNTRIWSLSLFIISIVTVVWAVCNIAGIKLPDLVIRTMGILDIIAIAVLVYTSLKKRK